MSNRGNLIIFAAPSGAGKSSLINGMIEKDKDSYELSISATTRSPREGETHGKDYFLSLIHI